MLEDLTPPVKRTPCKVRTILEQLDEKDQSILLAALADHEAWTSNGLARALSQRGLVITEKPIRKHRNRECSC
jgi:DNA-binding HxlR family transcriptional regulator